MLSETSAVFDIPPGSGFAAGGITESTPAAAQIYWDTWFGPFFQFISDNPRIKAFNYIDWNWPAHGFPWVDSRIENNPTLVGMIATELAKSKYIHRDAPLKFQRPFLLDLGANKSEGSSLSIRGSNGDPFATGLAPLVGFFYGGAKIIQPSPNPGYLNYTIGVPALGQYWFLASPYLGALPPTASNPDGTFRLDLVLPPPGSGLAGTKVFFQAVVQPSGASNRLTQPFELMIS
jgi:hypothetical protein